jgi:hypothetical protein
LVLEDSVLVDGLVDAFFSDDPFTESLLEPESFFSVEPESERLSVR